VTLRRALDVAGLAVQPESLLWAEIELKYEGYISRERISAERLLELDDFSLPEDLPYRSIQTISFEAREKLSRQRPATIGLASRIPGVSPSDLQALLFEVARKRQRAPASVSRETATCPDLPTDGGPVRSSL
jgi:tRNA uridine 5-carboxymethylaminomethyl modification enzyme